MKSKEKAGKHKTKPNCIPWNEIDSKLKRLKCRSNSTTNSIKPIKNEIDSKAKGKEPNKHKAYKYNKFMELISISKNIPYQNQKTKEGIKEINKLIASDLSYSQLLTASNEISMKQSALVHQHSCSSFHGPKNSVYNRLIHDVSPSSKLNPKVNSRNKGKEPLSTSINSTVNVFEEKKALEDFCKSFELISNKKDTNIKIGKPKALLVLSQKVVNKGKRPQLCEFK